LTTLTEATKDNFFDLVADGTVLVDVWGPSCQPCLALLPHVEALAARRDDLRVVKLEAPKARRICMELRLMGLPAFLLFRDGAEVARLSDPNLTADELEKWLAASAGSATATEGEESC
jgi:thioredoxin 1